ncbi:hypothetical protein [Tsukamurella spumae]|uniref:Uncharacterized protein n=1 Tax=Tsukamurella spumae TaxID=44753 RepID=A0A846WYU3_9ACTN|nr:hypothetical protein [Tsukamurella spumae]NKY18051.1 hypothetical protein [Tsukamurella spumae]
MSELTSPVLWTIAACEIGFWILVLGGLTLRYVLRARRAGTVALALVPVLDVVLIAAVAIDLHRGGEVGTAHRLAGIYLGCTLMFGHRMITWADERFAHRFAGGPAPRRVPKLGPERTRKEWADFYRWLGAVAIAVAVSSGLGYTVADETQRAALTRGFGMLGVVTVIWLLTGPLWVMGRRERRSA